MANALKAVLVGCGGMGGRWLESARLIPGLKVEGLVDTREEAARERAEKFGVRNAAIGCELRPILRSLRPDVVFDCTVPEAHVDVALEALRNGCHVLGEKPMADSMENARRMLSAARRAKRICAITQSRRYIPQLRALRRFIGANRIGDMTMLNSDFYIGAHFGGFRDRMRHVLLLDMAIHTFDAARYLSQADPIAVYCQEWNPRGSWYDHDAGAVAIFEMSNGAVYTYRGCWCAEGENTSWESQWRIVGTKGSIIWDGADAMHAQVVKAPGGFISNMKDVTVPLSAKPATRGHHAIMSEFVRCIRTGAVPETSYEDNIRSLAMVFGAIESARRQERVKLA